MIGYKRSIPLRARTGEVHRSSATTCLNAHSQGIPSAASPNESENLHVGRKATPNAPQPSIPPGCTALKTPHYFVRGALNAPVGYPSKASIPTQERWTSLGLRRSMSRGWLPPTCRPSDTFSRPAAGSWVRNSCGVRGRLKRTRLKPQGVAPPGVTDRRAPTKSPAP